MTFTSRIDSQVIASMLLDDEMSQSEFDAALAVIKADPAMMTALAASQFVNDALQGHLCLDDNFTARIMQYIAVSEAKRLAESDDESGQG
ncbi:MAG: adenine deaminase [Burkholderiaceae bacterium]